jgi:hypothetical protein
MRFLKRHSESDLETRLRQSRPQPRAELMQRLSDHVAESRPRRRSTRGAIAVVGVAIVVMLALFGAFGGVGYAASAAKDVVVAAKNVVVAPVETKKADTQLNNNAGATSSNTNGQGNDQKQNGTNEGGKPDDKEYGHKTTICHNPGPHQQTLEVSDNAVPAHLAHHDYLGACHN